MARRTNTFSISPGGNAGFSNAPVAFGLAPTGSTPRGTGAPPSTGGIALEDGSGLIALENGAAIIELEAGP